MKKVLTIFLCVGLLLQNFLFVIPVHATGSEEIVIESIKQGDTTLELIGDKYVTSIYDYVDINFRLLNFDSEKEYYQVLSSNRSTGLSNLSGESGYMSFLPSMEDTDYLLKICGDNSCNTVYASKEIKFDFQYYEKGKDIKAYIQNVTQDDVAVEPTISQYRDANFSFNDLKAIKLSVVGTNFDPTATYNIYGIGTSSHVLKQEVLGSQLNSGYTIEYYPNIFVPRNIEIRRGNIRITDLKFLLEESYLTTIFTYTPNSEIENFTIKPFYTDDLTQKIKENTDYFESTTIFYINSQYNNADKTLSLKIKGNNKYEDKDYNIKIEGLLNGTINYTENFTVNGLLLNEGYNLELTDYELQFVTEYGIEEIPNALYVTIDNTRQTANMVYNSIGDMPFIESNIFFENGKKNLSTFRGSGGYNWSGGVADTNKTAFTKYSSMYLNFRGYKFLNDEEYDYILEYGDVDTELFENNYTKVLKNGKINGKVFNEDGISFEVNNESNYKTPTYRFTIKKGTEIVYYSAPIIYLVDSPTLANVSLSANNKNLYLKTEDNSYVATRNAPIKIVISGLGFEELRSYKLSYCAYDTIDRGCKEVTFTGKELNDGTATINYDEEIPSTTEQLSFYVYSEENLSDEMVAIQGDFTVTFVDSSDFFPTLTKYVIDNGEDIIKNIKKLTTVSDFISNVPVSDNGKVKMFDKTGLIEQTGNVGTGMLARVLNEYEKSVLDLEVVVKGDVSGDGNITITDLVKTKRDLANIEKLDGVYSTAGDITGSGSIGITDLVKMKRDVASIEEIN